MPQLVRALLLSWDRAPDRLFQLFRLLAPPLLDFHLPPDADRSLTVLTYTLQLKLLRRDLCRKKLRVAQHASPHVADNLASLTNTPASIALRSLSRGQPHCRLSPRAYQLAIHRKLRLPCLPPELVAQPCPCGHATFDPFGVITSLGANAPANPPYVPTSATPLHAICADIGPWADFIASKHSVSIEPRNLVPNNPARPADGHVPFSQLCRLYWACTPPDPPPALPHDLLIPP